MEMKYDAPQKIIFILQTHPPKGVQKNILKFYGILLKIKSSTDNKSQKGFKDSNGQILLIVVLMVGFRLKL